MKLIHRYKLQIVSGLGDRPTETPSNVVASLYRGHLDASYQCMITEMLEYGRFDDFIGSVIRSTAVHGE